VLANILYSKVWYGVIFYRLERDEVLRGVGGFTVIKYYYTSYYIYIILCIICVRVYSPTCHRYMSDHTYILFVYYNTLYPCNIYYYKEYIDTCSVCAMLHCVGSTLQVSILLYIAIIIAVEYYCIPTVPRF